MRIFITATNTDIGKTYTTLKLIKALSEQNFKVGVIKPIETGVEQEPLDGKKLLDAMHKYNPDSIHLTMEDIVPIQYPLPAAPYIASNKKKLDLNLILKKIEKIEKCCDILLIEGAGGLYVPVDEKLMMIDLIEYFKVNSTLLVTHCKLGCINDTILSQNALKEKNLNFETIFNCFERESFDITSYPYIKDKMKSTYFLESDLDKIITKITSI